MELSIIIPAYNVEKYIKRTLDSLINQTKKEFEIIIVDDGSTDNTLKVIEKIISEGKLNNCKVIKKANGGVSSARNAGMYEANGKYVMFLDGDDYVSVDFIDNIFKNICNNKSDIICWGYNLVDENLRTIKNYEDIYNLKYLNINGVEALKEIICNQNFGVWTGSIAYRNEFLKQYNLIYTEGCVSGEDQEFIIKALSRANRVIFIDKILSFYLQRGTSISNSYNIKRFDAIGAMERTYKYIKAIGDCEFKPIQDIIKNNNIVDNYISNFISCFSCLCKNCTAKKENFKKLYDDIECEYPNLNKKVTTIMKDYNGKSIKKFLKYKIFLISPLIYIRLFNLKNKK